MSRVFPRPPFAHLDAEKKLALGKRIEVDVAIGADCDSIEPHSVFRRVKLLGRGSSRTKLHPRQLFERVRPRDIRVPSGAADMLSGKARSPGTSMELRVSAEYAGKATVKTFAKRTAKVIGGCLTWLMTAHHGSCSNKTKKMMVPAGPGPPSDPPHPWPAPKGESH